jgi:hypothetical protein
MVEDCFNNQNVPFYAVIVHKFLCQFGLADEVSHQFRQYLQAVKLVARDDASREQS